ncbi:Protein PBN1 [Cladobotryum mycophilum]|uniref:Protein PBN1 n=1 Tax=Cladobotryum mycophilum TaxID=491253 RepID=A0ABR0SAC2_9HYPO
MALSLVAQTKTRVFASAIDVGKRLSTAPLTTRSYSLVTRRFQFMSDLHLEIGQQYASFDFPAVAPFLVLAGDIGSLRDHDGYLAFLRRQTTRYNRVFLVLGNHEFYGIDYRTGLEKAQWLASDVSLEGKATLLHKRRYDLPDDSGVSILGCTLWSRIPDESSAAIAKGLNDYRQIQGWTVESHNKAHCNEVSWLQRQINEIQRDTEAPSGAVLVVTHHAPMMTGSGNPRFDANTCIYNNAGENHVHSPPGGAIDPTSLDIQDTKVQGPAIEAIREDKFTFTLQELPSELTGVLRNLKELHLRWTSPSGHGSLEPFSSRLSPGFHLSYTPSKQETHDPTHLCSILQAFGSLECTSPEAFTDLREGRHAGSAASYFYQDLENLDDFAAKASEIVCTNADSTCKARLLNLGSATGLDISYESTSQSFKISASWPLQQHEISASASPNRRTEVGILGRDMPPNLKPHELGISGILTVVGQQKEPSPTLFSFPSRHRITDGSFSSKFLTPTGLHPTLQLNVDTERPGEEDDECDLYAYLTLPKIIFADRYQLADELFLASKNLSATSYVSQPVDLEAPAYTTKTWGSNVLVKLAQPSIDSTEGTRIAEVPLHLRYLKPSQTGQVDTEVPYPVVFWACDNGAGTDFSNNPFDRLHLGYDGLFSQSTVFWHVSPKPEVGNRLTNPISVPVVTDEASKWVGLGTTAAVGLGFVWVLWKLLGVYSSSGHGSVEPTSKGQESKESKKRNKLEQLEQEVKIIQKAVQTKGGDSAWSPPSPRTAFSASSADQPPLSAGLRPTSTQNAAPLADPPTTLHAPVFPLQRRPKTGPTETRYLDKHAISGEEIDYYFTKFLQFFHPFLPLLRKKDPDECYQAQPMLFWVILYVTCRRYAKNEELFTMLLEHISKKIWSMLSIPALGLEEIHAILFICAWPLPTVRFATDPSSMLANVAMNASMMLGLHTGRGSNPQFCVGLRNPLTSTDEEASATWAACCILAQKASTSTGHPPPSFQFIDTRCKSNLETSYWADLLTMYNFQKFLNRFHAAAFAQVSASNSVPENTLRMWEVELEMLKPSMIRYDTEMARLTYQAALLEIQLYYFQGQPMENPVDPNLHMNTLKTFNTARALVLNAMDLEDRSRFIFHTTHAIFRSLMDAACVIAYLLHSVWAPDNMSPEDTDFLARRACESVLRCSIREADLPFRGEIIIETFWNHRELVPMFDSLPPAWLDRGNAGLTYGCLERFKAGMLTAQKTTDGVNKALKFIHPTRPDPTAGGTASTDNPDQESTTSTGELFHDVDLNMLMDDFSWVGGDGVILSLF